MNENNDLRDWADIRLFLAVLDQGSLVGASDMIAIENGSLVMGTWQGIYFCEFDGPRQRKLHIKVMPE